MAAASYWQPDWFLTEWFPAVWFAPADETGVPPEELRREFTSGGADAKYDGTRRLVRPAKLTGRWWLDEEDTYPPFASRTPAAVVDEPTLAVLPDPVATPPAKVRATVVSAPRTEAPVTVRRAQTPQAPRVDAAKRPAESRQREAALLATALITLFDDDD